MVVFKCDACQKICNTKDIIILAEFPRRTYQSVKDAFGVTLLSLQDTTFTETHFCQECYNKLLNFTSFVVEREYMTNE